MKKRGGDRVVVFVRRRGTEGWVGAAVWGAAMMNIQVLPRVSAGLNEDAASLARPQRLTMDAPRTTHMREERD